MHAVIALVALSALADGIHTSAERGQLPLPVADRVVIIGQNTASVYSAGNKWIEPIAIGRMPVMPTDKQRMRTATLEFILQVAAGLDDGSAMFLIITDEFTPLEYKAYIKRLEPGDLKKIQPPRNANG
jgi:hypothetical protein